MTHNDTFLLRNELALKLAALINEDGRIDVHRDDIADVTREIAEELIVEDWVVSMPSEKDDLEPVKERLDPAAWVGELSGTRYSTGGGNVIFSPRATYSQDPEDYL